MSFEYSAAQLTASLIKALNDPAATDEIKEGIAALLAFHYPKEYEALRVAVTVALMLPERAP